jgi:hypothetical protein
MSVQAVTAHGGDRSGRLRRLGDVLLRPSVVAAVFVLLAVGAGVQRLMLGESVVGDGTYTHYNNYVVFRASFAHLVAGQDLYVAYPAEHWDLFKYSPTFAVLMAPFAMLPDSLGVVIWGLVGSLALFAGIWRFPMGDERSRMAAAWFVVLPLLQSLQNTQSNAHLAGLILLAFVWLERRQASWAALAIALAFFLKIYGAAAILLAVLYPWRLRVGLFVVLWTVALGLLPLVFVPPSHLAFLYESWAGLLAADHSASTGVSVMGWLHNWFGVDPPTLAVAGAGAALMLLPLRQVRAWADPSFRALFVAALLVWVVIFNHKTEPNTFVIAVTGVALWYFVRPCTRLSLTLLVLVFAFTCLSTTSVFPTVLRRSLVQPFSLRVLPCILVWAVAVFELSRRRGDPAATRSARHLP